MSQSSKLYGDAYLDGHKSYALVGTDADGKIIEETVDLSGYLTLDQTTPQTTVGNFSFPSVSVTNGAVVNEVGGDYDFRVEGDTKTHLLFVDASTDRVGINSSAPVYNLDVVNDDAADAGIAVKTLTYVNIPYPGSLTNLALLSPRGFNFCTDGYTLAVAFQPSLGIGLAGNRGPMLGIKASATGAAIAIEQGRIGVGTSGPQEPIDCIGNILTRSTSGTAYETRTRMVSTYYAGASNYASGGLEIDGVQAAVGYGLYGATRFYAGANTDATRGWAWKADGLLLTTTLALSTGQMVLNKAGNLVIGGVAASARLHLISTTEQLRVGYNASNYLSVTVGSTGSVTTALTGTSPINIFSQAIRGNGGFQSSDGTAGIAGTKVYYVSDSSGGTVNRKLTFKDGILTAET
jgi:hypothetical protein